MSDTPTEVEEFVMPAWMENYRRHIDKLAGGNPVEELMNDRNVNAFSNSIRFALVLQVRAVVNTLFAMHEEGELKYE
jgi:hypothetical protein